MDDRWENRNYEQVRVLVRGMGCLATFGTEGRIPDGYDGRRKRRQIMFHP
jgi:hypothetical protein